MYDGKDTRDRKPPQRLRDSYENVTFFAVCLSKASGQLMLMRASVIKSSILAILFL
jgi:hypothetical protein